MIGIYKITSPTNKVYIGQSVDIERRFKSYKRGDCKEQKKLFNSFVKHGAKNHLFEVLEQCDIKELNEKERFYQDLYKVLSKNGLNCRLTTSECKSGRLSDETKKLIGKNSGKSRTGMKLSNSHKEKIASFHRGKPKSELAIKRLSESRKGIVFSPEHIENLKLSHGTKVIDTETGVVYNSIKEASQKLGLKESTLCARLRGRLVNKTTLRYL